MAVNTRLRLILPDIGGRMLNGRHGHDRSGRKLFGANWAKSSTTSDITPVTYVNSAASLKAFCWPAAVALFARPATRPLGSSGFFRRTKARCCFFPINIWDEIQRYVMGIPRSRRCRFGYPHGRRIGGNSTVEALASSRVVLWERALQRP